MKSTYNQRAIGEELRKILTNPSRLAAVSIGDTPTVLSLKIQQSWLAHGLRVFFTESYEPSGRCAASLLFDVPACCVRHGLRFLVDDSPDADRSLDAAVRRNPERQRVHHHIGRWIWNDQRRDCERVRVDG